MGAEQSGEVKEDTAEVIDESPFNWDDGPELTSREKTARWIREAQD